MSHREEPLFRPPAEADSLIFQVALGCPNNTCTFCGMYKGRRYTEKSLNQIEAEMQLAAKQYPQAHRIFLADGDAMHMEYAALLPILQAACSTFKNLARISLYANSISINGKSAEELAGLKAQKLHTVYVGLESGSDAVLAQLRKKDRAFDALKAAALLRNAGIRLSVMVLVGAGGRLQSADHVSSTVRLLNEMQPPLLSLLTMIPIPGTTLCNEIDKGRFVPLDKEGVLRELHSIIKGLNLHHTVFRANHTSNPLPLEGRLPKGRDSLLRQIDIMLSDKIFLNEENWADSFSL